MNTLRKPYLPKLYKFTPYIISPILFILVTACGGGGGSDAEGNFTAANQTRDVTGVVVLAGQGGASALVAEDDAVNSNATLAGPQGTFMVRAIDREGFVYEADTEPITNMFHLELPIDEYYSMSFFAHMGPGMMDESLDQMVFPCGDEHMGEFHNQFYLPPGDTPINFGDITVHSDHRFAIPTHNPFDETDADGDGIPDFNDSDFVCGNVNDNDNDGYYDDDIDHDGYHDQDMDRDGFHDDDHDRDGFMDGQNPPMGPGEMGPGEIGPDNMGPH